MRHDSSGVYGPPPHPSPVNGAGLSHVTEEIEQESIVPSCALELGSQGDFCVGMSAGDIEGEAPQDGEVGWGIVLSIARQVLVEHDIERPKIGRASCRERGRKA